MDPDATDYYNKQKQNRVSSHMYSQQQQQQILYQQQIQQQQIIKQRHSQGKVYYHNANPQAVNNKQYKPVASHRTVDTSHASSSGSNTNTGTGTSLKAKDLLESLNKAIALLPGGRDKRGGPVLCFPSNSRADEIEIEELYILVRYLTFLPDDNVKKLKFSVVIDMRAGTTWHSVKPILKVLEECIGCCTSVVFIIKPDKFLEKQKAQMASNKFNFDIQIVSLTTLYQEIDQSQLTKDFGGHLPYDNEDWIQIRIYLEDFFTKAHDMSDKFSSLYKFLDRKDNPDSVTESKRRLDEHKAQRLKIIQAPVHILEAEGDKLTHWLRYGTNNTGNKTSWVTMNPDYQQLIPQVKKTVQQLYEYRAHLQHKYESGRSRWEQIHQLRLFEDDIGRMSSWLNHQRHLFLTEYHDIGQSASQAADLYAEHRQFLVNCGEVREQVSRLNGVANMLSDSGHYASQQIQTQARKLEHDWKSFRTALEDRSNVLQLSASFHARAEAFVANCPHWEQAMKQHQQPTQPETVLSLSQCIAGLQQLWNEAQRAHEEVCSDGRALANHLSSPVPRGSHTSLAAAVDYSEGRKHCTNLVHELWACFKRVETVHANRKKRLTSRLSLLMFREDVAQVLAWLNEHGEPFLKRQTAVGKTLQRAEQLYNAHMQFEEVAANTLTNADKLIAAADDLVAQAHSPEEILQEETELERRIKAFTKSVETRRNTLDLAVGFHNHTKELFRCFHQLKENHNSAEMLPFTIVDVEDELRRFRSENRQILELAEKVLREGSTLCARIVEDDEKSHFKALLSQVANGKETSTDLLTERQVRLDLCLQLRLFEADVASSMEYLKHNVPTSNDCYFLSEPRNASSMNELEEVTATFLAAIKSGDEVIQKGTELRRAFESVGVNFPAGGNGSNDSGVVDSAEYAVERIQRLIYELTDLVMSVDEVNMKLKIELDWRRLEQQSQQVLTWIGQCDEMLRRTALVPSNLSESEQLQLEHDKFQPILNEAHPQAVTCAAFAEMYIQQISNNLNNSAANNTVECSEEQLSNANPTYATILSRKKEAQNIAELVADQWQKLVYAAEEKHKLLIAAGNWYKTSEQVTSVLRSLEKEYRRAEDWCQNEKANTRGDHVTYLGELLSRHFEQKEAFLKACILARRTSEQFIKYLGRQPVRTPGKSVVQEKVDNAIKDLMVKEQAVLQAWAARKSRLDECLEFIRVKTDADELMSHFDEAGVTSPKLDDAYKKLIYTLETKNLSHHAEVVKVIRTRLNSRFANQLLLKTSQISSSTTTNTAGTGQINPPVAVVPSANKLRTQISSGSSTETANRSSMSSTGSGGSNNTTGTISTTSTTITSGISSGHSSSASQQQEKLTKQRINLIKEMISTEDVYVNDLQMFIDTYYKALTDNETAASLKVPMDLVKKVDMIFSNIKEIHEFHQQVFLPEIRKYQPNPLSDNNNNVCFLPEDIGHCFIRYSNDLKKIYVKYCANKDEANKLMLEKMEVFNEIMQHFFTGEEQMKNTMQSYWIKPVQRITKYTIFLKDLYNNCDSGSAGELSEAWECMLEVNKRINDEIHLKDIRGLPEDKPLEALGDFILMDDFIVWEPRQIIKKGRDRRIFLFDVCMLLTKKCQSDDGKNVYQYKSHVLMTECNITEHIEGDQCKFALWNGRVPPLGDYRLVLKSKDLEIKQKWVRALREIMQERIFSFNSVYDDNSRNRMTSSTSDSPSVASSSDHIYYVMENYKNTVDATHLSVERNQRVQLLEIDGDFALVKKLAGNNLTVEGKNEAPSNQAQPQGLVPCKLLVNITTRRCLATEEQKMNATTAGNLAASSTGGGVVKKWLKERRGSTSNNPPIRRNSKSSQEPIATSSVALVATAANENIPSGTILLDNVSEESVDVELPPPMALQDFPVLPPNQNQPTNEVTSTTTNSNTPTKEEQSPLIGASSPSANEDQQQQHISSIDNNNRASNSTIKPPELFSESNGNGNNGFMASTPDSCCDEAANAAECGYGASGISMEHDDESSMVTEQTYQIKSSDNNCSTIDPSVETIEAENTSSSNYNSSYIQNQIGTVLPAELDELGLALEKNLRLSRQARQESERYHQTWQQHLTSPNSNGNGSNGNNNSSSNNSTNAVSPSPLPSSNTLGSNNHSSTSNRTNHPTGTLDSVSSKASRASQDSDKALSTSQSSCSGGGGCTVFCTGAGIDENESSSPILVAPRILDLPGNGDERMLGDLRLSDGMHVSSHLCSSIQEAALLATITNDNNISSSNITGSHGASFHSNNIDDESYFHGNNDDDSFMEQPQLNFTNRRFLLYETGLILITDVLEQSPPPPHYQDLVGDGSCSPPMSAEHQLSSSVDSLGGSGGLISTNQCQPTLVRCKHVLSLARLTIKDDLDKTEDGRRRHRLPSSKLLWFCLLEELGSANQSVMCHIVDPVTPDARARWLAELSQMMVRYYDNSGSCSSNTAGAMTMHSNNTNNYNLGFSMTTGISSPQPVAPPPPPVALHSTNRSAPIDIATTSTAVPTASTASASSPQQQISSAFNNIACSVNANKVPSLFQLKSDPIDFDKSKSNNKKSSKSLLGTSKSKSAKSESSSNKKESKHRLSNSNNPQNSTSKNKQR